MWVRECGLPIQWMQAAGTLAANDKFTCGGGWRDFDP
jgi:hypothetical protein